mgnify:CR=1 FL=1
MFKQRQGAFLGKKFEWYYPHSRKDLKKIAQRAIPDFRFSWKINKKTDFIVPGIDAPQDQLDEAKDRGLDGKYALTLQNTTQQPLLPTLKHIGLGHKKNDQLLIFFRLVGQWL